MSDSLPDISKEHKKLEDIYKTLAPDEIPWNTEVPPDVLMNLVEKGVVKPCRCIDLGCGAGNFSLYMAKNGFDVVGVDLSASALRLAKENARQAGIECAFVQADISGDLREVSGTFGFAYDWAVLHHIYPEYRDAYMKNVQRILDHGAKYLSLCFSEKSLQFGGTGRYRRTPLGTTLYFSGEEEMKTLYSRYFKIIELRTIEVPGRHGPHLANYAFLEKQR